MVTETDDESAAAEAARAEDPAADTRRWLLEVHDGALSTLSAKGELEGYPFGSVVPFALTSSGAPFVYLARIAAHTANLRRDNRASLLVRQPGLDGDPQQGWRITLMGRMKKLVFNDDTAAAQDDALVERVSAAEHEELFARYHERVSGADQYRGTHDFSFWRMSAVEKVRYIAGFGKICWLDGAEIAREPLGAGLDAAAAGAIAHMNADHVENMREMCVGLYGLSPATVAMRALDRTGFVLETRGPDRLLHFSFGREIAGGDVRRAVIEVLQRARGSSSSF